MVLNGMVEAIIMEKRSYINVKLKSGGGSQQIVMVGTLNQNTTGSAATLTTSRNINNKAANGSSDIKIPGTIVYSKSLNRSLSALSVSSSGWSEIHTDLRMKYVDTNYNIMSFIISEN